MKPSERIEEIKKEIHTCDGITGVCNLCADDTRLNMFAIITYLDEQYEQQKPCEHKNTEDIYGIKHCLDCRLVGNF